MSGKLSTNLSNTLLKIKEWFEPFSGAIIAFSGGIDSALVLFLSRKYLGKNKTIGVISNSESLKNKDYKLAIEFAKKNDILLETIYTQELSDPNYNTNPSNRCYYCKTHLYTELQKTKEKHPDFIILNGTNKDDLGDYRPGLQAASENSVRSPLSELGINKKEVRELAKYFEIPFWNKPASPCLSSRIPYGDIVSASKLLEIEQAELILNSFGFRDVRVRHFDKICKIEVPFAKMTFLKDLSVEIIPLIKAIGFEECIIEEDGLVSGKLNHVLNLTNV